jgi:ABC exporter DevB family membrane fusion protein
MNPMMLRRILAIGFPVVLLGGAAAFGLYFWLIRPPLKTAIAQVGNLTFSVSANGRVTAAEQMDVGPKVGGRVTELAVKEGDQVRVGQLLSRLDDQELRARLRQAESAVAVAKARWDEAKSGPRRQEVEEARAAVEAAQVQLDLAKDQRARVQRLFEAEVAPQAERDDARRTTDLREAQLRGARERLSLVEAGPRQETVDAAAAAYREALASVESIRAQLDNMVIRSPMNAQVIAKHLERGSVVRAGEPLYTLADTTRLIVRAEVEETDVGKIRLGLPAVITSDAFPGRKINGTVQKIAWRVGRKRIRSDNPAEITDTKVLEAEIPIEPDAELRIGMAMDVRIATGRKDNVVLIPRAAVQRRGSDLLVSVVRGDKTLEVRSVQLGVTEGPNVEVVAGLRRGEAVVVGRE